MSYSLRNAPEHHPCRYEYRLSLKAKHILENERVQQHVDQQMAFDLLNANKVMHQFNEHGQLKKLEDGAL
jgi:hypothetical protein